MMRTLNLLPETTVPTSAFLSDFPSPVLGGMPMVNLSDFAEARLELISLFFFGILVSAFVVKTVWNGFRKDFTSLPELTYGKAFSLVCLWGLLFVIVLTMISGARELMTPGAWIKKGNTYALDTDRSAEAPANSQPADDVTAARRKMNLELIWGILKDAGVLQQESLPVNGEELPIPQRMWNLPETQGLKYVYIPGLEAGKDSQGLLAEPEFFDNGRYVLWQEGKIELIPPGQPMPFETGAE